MRLSRGRHGEDRSSRTRGFDKVCHRRRGARDVFGELGSRPCTRVDNRRHFASVPGNGSVGDFQEFNPHSDRVALRSLEEAVLVPLDDTPSQLEIDYHHQ